MLRCIALLSLIDSAADSGRNAFVNDANVNPKYVASNIVRGNYPEYLRLTGSPLNSKELDTACELAAMATVSKEIAKYVSDANCATCDYKNAVINRRDVKNAALLVILAGNDNISVDNIVNSYRAYENVCCEKFNEAVKKLDEVVKYITNYRENLFRVRLKSST